MEWIKLDSKNVKYDTRIKTIDGDSIGVFLGYDLNETPGALFVNDKIRFVLHIDDIEQLGKLLLEAKSLLLETHK